MSAGKMFKKKDTFQIITIESFNFSLLKISKGIKMGTTSACTIKTLNTDVRYLKKSEFHFNSGVCPADASLFLTSHDLLPGCSG